MATRIGRYTLQMDNRPCVEGYASVVGKKESEGPLGKYFDKSFEDTTLGESSWEKAESRLQTEAVTAALTKAGTTTKDIDYIFAGDLLDQCISSTFGLRSLDIRFWGSSAPAPRWRRRWRSHPSLWIPARRGGRWR